jgi:Rieske Fe-S protein
MENNSRRSFLKDTCKVCLLGATTFSIAEFLVSCGTTAKGFKTTVTDNKIEVPLSLFDTSNSQIISPRNYEYEIAVQKNTDNTFQALLLRCTHQNNQLIPTGSGYYCSLHGSQYDKQGNVKKGPAEKGLPCLTIETTPTNLIIHI